MRKRGRKALLWLGAMAMGATLVFSPMTAKAAGVPIDKDHFPDRIFREYVQKNFDTNGDKSLSEKELAACEEISVESMGIQDLSGLEHFTSLKRLYCKDNQLKKLDVSKNKNLVYLWCNDNQLTSLDVSSNTGLQWLWCDNNAIKSLDLSQNRWLETLLCQHCELSSLDISSNPQLWGLYVDGNQLTELDVSNNLKLMDISCVDNKLTNLDIDRLKNLKDLMCSGNALTSLNTDACGELEIIMCYDNALTSLDLSKNTKLRYFDDLHEKHDSIQNYNLVLAVGQDTFDLTKLPGQFDVKKASNWKGGTVSGNILTITGSKVTYTYDCGQDKTIDVTLNVTKEKLSTPVITKLENASAGVKATWGAVEGAEMYRLLYKEPGGTFKTGGYTTGTSYTVKNLESGVEYAFTVRCMTADKKANTSDYDRIGTTIKYIAAPAISKVTNASNGVKVEWAASAGAELYKVMYKEAGGSYKTAGYTTDTSYTVTGLTSGTEYTFTARCMTSDKKTYTSSYNSKGLSIVYKPAAAKLATPVITKLENTTSGVKVTWGAVEGAEMYRLMYKEPDGTFKTGGYTTGTSYTVKNLTGGVTYAFTVRCMTADKKANTSDYDKVGTTTTYIATPVLTKVANTSTGVKVTWEAAAGAQLYKVMYMEKDGTWKTGGYTTGTSYTVKKLTEGTEYAFTVRCMTADKSAYTSGYDKVGLSIRFGN